MKLFAILLVFLCNIICCADAGFLSGTVSLSPQDWNLHSNGMIMLKCLEVSVNASKVPIPLSITSLWQQTPILSNSFQLVNGSTSFRLDGLAIDKYYALFAYVMTEGQQLDLEAHVPLGWFSSEAGGWIAPILADGDVPNLNFVLRYVF